MSWYRGPVDIRFCLSRDELDFLVIFRPPSREKPPQILIQNILASNIAVVAVPGHDFCVVVGSGTATPIQSTVVKWQNTVAGYANFYHWEKDGCAIGNLVVVSQAPGRGIGGSSGSWLDWPATNTTHQHNANLAQLFSFNYNTQAVLLYARLGFFLFAFETWQ